MTMNLNNGNDGSRQNARVTKSVWSAALACLAFFLGASARAEEAKPVVLGLCSGDADKYNVEFQQYDRMMPVYRENGIRAALIELGPFVSQDYAEDQLLAMMKKSHVVHLTIPIEAVAVFDDVQKKRAAIVGRALARYVEEGGGLFIEPQSVRYPGAQDEDYWNAVLAPLGAEILHEGAFDKTRSFAAKATFWHTRNIQAHPVTKDVSQLYLPLHGCGGESPGLTAMRYGPDWRVLVRGEKEAKSYRSVTDNKIDLNTEGTYTEAPPVLAVRQLGKGRLVCYPVAAFYTGINHRNPLWDDIVESNGDRAAGQASDSMKMQMNAYRWLAEPSSGLTNFGTYVAAPYRPIQYPAKVEWGQKFAAPATSGIRGIAGVHSAYSDGTGTVAEYVRAAKAAGLSFIVFNDPLEALTKETLGKLKADCAAASTIGDFYACPGIEFTDGIGNRWAMWGERIAFPAASFNDGQRDYVLWDGKTIRQFGYFEASSCAYSSVALLDYNQLRKNGAHPEN
ncbi:MAG: hypothetical protein PHR35_02735, partial [Kiritimatiellae bacterium]|nr:hypothetical protein [Kiritimatiellia bacterium]